jgi:ethanolamine ammonia-lyase small subunit
MSSMMRTDLAARLRAVTPARVGLARTGVSQQTRDLLDFQSAHAQARDAVHARMEAAALAAAIAEISGGEVFRLHSAAPDRATYLQRPDLGRKLDDESRVALTRAERKHRGPWDLAVIVADGLSALAVERHAQPLLKELIVRLENWWMAPVCVVEQGRVAIGDEIGEALGAEIAVMLIGERPGLSSPDSLGAYVTWHPRVGRTDAERNCISNIRTEGLNYERAGELLVQSLAEARRRKLTGVERGNLKPQLEEGSCE